MENKQDNQGRKTITQASLTMRILAGGWLLYLVYQMISGLDTATGNTKIISIICIVLFLVAGLTILGHSIYLWKIKAYDDGSDKEAGE
ncbi:MAG: hypothetical protein IJP31_00190 [Lachnospiraceae bacterium]|nr:hypothetical protein [Lachnospiraceae bacterium]